MYNKEGKIRGQVAVAPLFCTVQCLVISTLLTFHLQKLMTEVSSTSLSISHISKVMLSSPRVDKSILAQMALSMVLLGKVLKSCAKEADFK